jgi:glycosyltransferase involved in cell wall biosynthesis
MLHKLPSKLWYNIIAKRFFRGVPIVARSEEARQFISQFCNNVSDKIIDHGVNLEKFVPCDDKEDFFIVSSQLIERKQIDKIIRAFSDFAKDKPSYKLYIFGEGECEAELKALTGELSLEDRVIFFGKTSHSELKEYLARAKALLVYTRKDNNMISVVEAIACGTPIITTSVPYNASYIRENELGIVSDTWGKKELEEICEKQRFYRDNCMKYRSFISAESKVKQFIDKKEGRNILLSSYSVNPYHGSEDGIGWNWTLQAAKHFNKPDDRIYLVTKKVNEADTRRGIEENGLNNVKLIISDTPDWLNWYREHRSVFHHLYYILWQGYAYRWVKKSKIDFDIVHHVTMVDFRIPGKMWKLRGPYKIFGPVGGGQSTPAALKDYEKSKAVERFRELINQSCAVLPSYKRAISRFDRAFAINKETEAYMSRALGSHCQRLTELALANEFRALTLDEKPDYKEVKLLYLGRLIEKKGLMLLLDVVNKMQGDLPFTLEVYGGGPLETQAKEYIEAHGLSDRVKLCGEVKHTEVSTVYAGADVFIMPSLRETSGNVLVEAMAHRLPIAALDMSVGSDFKEYDCGVFINVNQSKEEIINEFADRLTYLINSPEERKRMGENGYRFVNTELSWDKKFETVYQGVIRNEQIKGTD